MQTTAIVPDTLLWAAFRAALQDSDLPTDNLRDPGQHFFAYGKDAAFGGFALAGPVCLLRSLVVLPEHRGSGLGRSLVEAVLDEARSLGARVAWLLTTSAAGLFAKSGFRVAERIDAPLAVAGSRQFSSLCPSSAVLMWRPLA